MAEPRGKFIEAYRIDRYLREHFECKNSAAGIYEALAFFLANKHYEEYIAPFDEREDIILMKEEDFLHSLGNLPVSLDFADSEKFCLPDEFLIPADYDCHVIKHFNYQQDVIHSHLFFEICYVWKGSCIQTINNEEHVVLEGGFFYIPPNVLHNIRVLDKTSVIINILIRKAAFDTSFFAIMAKNTTLSTFFRNILYGNQSMRYMLIQTDNSIYLKRIVMHLVFQCYNHSPIFDNATSGIMILLFSFMLQRGIPEIEITNKWVNKNNHIFQIMHYIQQNFKTVTLTGLSEQFHFSESYLSRLIRGASGDTFSTHIRRIRLQKAKDLLVRTDLPIEMICEKVGYGDVTHFIRIVKKDTGMTPSTYRKNQLA